MIFIELLLLIIIKFILPIFFVTSKEQTELAIRKIQDDLLKQIYYFNELGDNIKAQRIKERVEYDME